MRIISLLLIFLIAESGIHAQQHYSTWWNPELRLNPALTGIMPAKWRLRETFRNQYYENAPSIRTNNIFADTRKEFSKEVGGYGMTMTESTGRSIGYGIMDERRRSDSDSAAFIADYFSLAFHRRIKKSDVSIGVQPGYMRNSVDRKFDFNAGIFFGTDMIRCWQEDQFFKTQFGIAGYNLLSDFADSSLLPGREIQAHFGTLIEKPKHFDIVANAFYSYTGMHNFGFGAVVLFFPIVHYKFWDRTRLGLHYRSSNHLTFSAGMRIFGSGQKSLSVDGMISYDLPLKFMEFNSTYKNGWEISLVLTPLVKCWSLDPCGH